MLKTKTPFLFILLFFIVGTSLSFWIMTSVQEDSVDVIVLNRMMKSVETHWDDLASGDYDSFPYDFAVIDPQGTILYETKDTLDLSIPSALKSRDAILDIVRDKEVLGKVVIATHLQDAMHQTQWKLSVFLFIVFTLVSFILLAYMRFIYKRILNPFNHLQTFAKQIASGNLDVPLAMDRNNIFGAFSESFDIMRQELSLARQKEYEANKSKKELVASLSHDIKTPVTSIKLISELLLVKTQDPMLTTKLKTIYDKAEQINLLVTDLFHTTLEDLGELQVSPSEHYSTLLKDLLKDADYYERVRLHTIPDCLLFVDPLRLAQVINNIIANAYKYGGPIIEVDCHLTSHFLEVRIKDNGSGVSPEDLPLLFNKFYRGKNTEHQNGSGLGLHIAKQLLCQMGGDLSCFNEPDGFTVLLLLKLY